MIVYVSVVSLFAIVLAVCTICFREKDVHYIPADATRPNKSPFYVALSLGLVPKMEEAIASYLLYWKDCGIIDMDGDDLRILKVLPDDTPKEERLIFQSIFGQSAVASISKLDKKKISDCLSSYASCVLSPFHFELKKSKTRRLFVLSGSFLASFLAGLFSTGFKFSLLSLSALLCTVALFLIYALLSRSYFEQKSQMGILSKIRFFTFPAVCTAFFLGLYGFVVSTEFGKACGMYMSIVVFLISFIGTFHSFSIFSLSRDRLLELEHFRLYASRLEKEEAQNEDVAYCTCFRIHTGTELSVQLRKKLVFYGISGFIPTKTSSGFGFFERNWRF